MMEINAVISDTGKLDAKIAEMQEKVNFEAESVQYLVRDNAHRVAGQIKYEEEYRKREKKYQLIFTNLTNFKMGQGGLGKK